MLAERSAEGRSVDQQYLPLAEVPDISQLVFQPRSSTSAAKPRPARSVQRQPPSVSTPSKRVVTSPQHQPLPSLQPSLQMPSRALRASPSLRTSTTARTNARTLPAQPETLDPPRALSQSPFSSSQALTSEQAARARPLSRAPARPPLLSTSTAAAPTSRTTSSGTKPPLPSSSSAASLKPRTQGPSAHNPYLSGPQLRQPRAKLQIEDVYMRMFSRANNVL